MQKRTLYIIPLLALLLFSCKKERTDAYSTDEQNKLDPTFEAITTPIHIYSGNGETYACFYENNYVKLTAYKPTISKYAWYRVENGTDLFLADSSNFTTSLEGLYKLSVEDEIPNFGTIDTSVYISLGYCSTHINIPTAFTPNMNTNSIWKPIYDGVRTIYLRIRNEDGDVMFETQSLTEGWDGKYNGNEMPEGTYFYYISGSYKSGYLFEKEGTLELSK